ncbi:hypothetical protein AAFF_G00276920 [Aldrovandia affinis]|uniref:Reverse transcriptase/retrotransposon-derived protein RNase H-like domain-containing protein n=1 Tax=Aldrovandia affinis TaxID=143900 RepID=A0AAD7W1V2_9TELE|nr:hypothetical protein AAFF_G00276920 [Aldrovandia affinis]
MAAAGVIEPSDSPWAAPAVLINKKDDSWRFCVDYQCLNAVTIKDSYPLPRIDDALDYISTTYKVSWVYYRRYVQDFATIASPLHRLTEQGRPYVWDNPCSTSFKTLQTALITAPVLAYPVVNRPFIIDTDGSNAGIGAVLSQ